MKTRRRVLHGVVLLLGTITAGILLSKGQSNVNMLQPVHWDILQIDKHYFKVSEPPQSHRKDSSDIFGYVISLRYGGQQSGGLGSLASLQCWIKSFDLPMLIAEPELKYSKFCAADKAKLRLGDILDIPGRMLSKTTFSFVRYKQS